MLANIVGYSAYNIDVEVAFGVVSLIFFLFMIGTKPRRTASYIYVFLGMLFSIFAPLLSCIIAYIASDMTTEKVPTLRSCMLLFIIVYSAILFNESMYLCTLPFRNRNKENWYRVVCLGFVALMDIYCITALYSGGMMTYTGGQVADISDFIVKMNHCGLVSSSFSLVFALTVTKDMPKVVRTIIFTVYPLDVLLLLLQRTNTSHIILAMTYVIPLALFFILFHSNPYDEILGLQNAYSLESRFEDNVFLKKPFYLGYMIIPSFNRIDVSSPTSQMNDAFESIVSYCRMVEDRYSNFHIYKQSAGTYTFIFDAEKSEENNIILDELGNIAEKVLYEVDELATIVMITLPYFKEIKTIAMAREMVNLLSKKHVNPLDNFRYMATDEDNRKFQERYRVEKELLDIRLRKDPDDDRVLCFAQPIYEVGSQSFRTAEALMRLKIDGEMVSPGLFIPIAEESNCIHALTLIMLEKVCMELAELDKEYDFECISINCSAKEFMLPGLSEEVMSIISKYGVDPKKIRLELTESAVADDNNKLKKNMYQLRENGVSFYLDDFGTGYSAMSRVIDLPFRTIKFDKTLLYQSIADNRMDGIVSNMIETLKNSGILTLVEGVESDAQNDYSITHGFEYIQGFHYAKPVPIADLRNYFSKK